MSILLFIAAFYKSPRWSSGILALIVLLSIIYQITGFMVWTIKSDIGLAFIIVSLGALLFNFFSARNEATSMAIAVFAIAMMFTPYYYLSIIFIVAAAVIGGLSSIGPISVTYVLTMIPLLLIENGFISATSGIGSSAPPLLFGQLVNFQNHMRPALPGLNIFLTWYPPNYFDSQVAAPVIAYLSSAKPFLLIVPLAILAIVFSLSAAAAGLINDMLDRLSVFERTSQLLKLISPLVASIVTPLAFSLLITTLSQRGTGGYETMLTSQVIVTMIIASVFLGAVFTAREYGIQWLERTEKARIAVSKRNQSLRDLIATNKQLVASAAAGASAINFTLEQTSVREVESSVGDIQKGLGTASFETLNEWITQLDEYAKRMNELPEAIRVKIIGELNFLSSLVVTYGNSLKEAGVEKRFSDLPEIPADIEFDKALESYARLLDEIRASSKDIFDFYRQTYDAYNIITSQLNMLPPVDPERLFESNDYDSGVKLLAEEYWLNFHIKNTQELSELVSALLESCGNLLPLLDPGSSSEISQIAEKMRNTRPVDSIVILEDIKSLKGTLDASFGRVESEIDQLSKLINSIPGASRVIGFEVFQKSDTLRKLRQWNLEARPNLRETRDIVNDATAFMKSFGESRKSDEGNLIIISQLPVAMKIIGDILAEKNSVEVSDLPFQQRPSLIYASLYTYYNPKAKYSEEDEVITKRNA